MDILNKSSYYNSINEAIVVNTDTNLDPLGLNRVQIYIPALQYKYRNEFEEYMTTDNKADAGGFKLFLWAVTLISDLKVGNVVYCSNIDNQVDQYIIIGLDVNNPSNNELDPSTMSYLGSDASGILDLAMPIIIHNEVGINVNDWPNNISNSRYTNINPYDNGGWSIGLIQWHHCRAFDCLFEIAKADGNWKNNWTSKNFDLYNDLDKSVKAGSATSYRTKYQASFHPTKGSTLYLCIQNMLGSESGKTTQRKFAEKDTSDSINIASKAGVTNPAIMIFLVDIMNQYGSGVSKTINAAASCCKGSGSIIDQLKEFKQWCSKNLGSYSTYIGRRNQTYSYIENLYNSGKLTTTMGDIKTNPNSVGQLFWPTPTCTSISSAYGNRTYTNKEGKKVSGFHTGIDLVKSGGSQGQPIYAAHAGTIATKNYGGESYGMLTTITDGNMTTYYAHQSKRADGIKDGVKVQRGQLIGYVGSTGNSTGPHLHFEVRINNQTQNPINYIKLKG